MKFTFESKITITFIISAILIIIIGIISFEKVTFITLTACALSFTIVIVSLIIIRKDLKDLKERNKEVRMLAQALRSIKESVTITDTSNNIIFVNESFEKIYGYSEKEVIGKKIDILRPGNSAAEVLKILPDTLKGGWSGELINKRKDGTEFTIQLSTSSVNDELNKPIALIGIANDISERKRTEEEIKNYIKELSQSKNVIAQNAEKLLELNSKLSESENQLKRLNESKDKFFSIISHDLRSPFNSILGLSELLKSEIDGYSKEEVQIFGTSIYNSSKHLLNLIDNLLEWSRVQTGKIEYEPSDCDLFTIVNNLVTVLKGNADKKKIKIENLVIKGTKVYADQYMLNSIIQNLISNAVKFTNEGGKVTISEEKDGNMSEISIIDSGVGIEEEDIKKLFVIGEKRTTPGTAKEKGTGLGLILCKELVEKNGGKICVESTLGKGSIFRFNLPIRKN